MPATKKSSTQKSANTIIDLVIYPFNIMLSIGESDDVLRKKLDGYGVDWEDDLSLPETCLGRATLFPCNRSRIRLKSFPKTNRDHGIIAHEIFHSVDFILDRIGLKLCPESNEAYAYLIGYITEQVYERIN